ncbi:hypothetical protein GBA52_022237, partial [Prunus armeniaca]
IDSKSAKSKWNGLFTRVIRTRHTKTQNHRADPLTLLVSIGTHTTLQTHLRLEREAAAEAIVMSTPSTPVQSVSSTSVRDDLMI